MNYQEFIEEMKQEMEKELGNSYQVEVRKIPGFNGQEKTGMTILEKSEKNQIVPVIYLEEVYELFLQEDDLVLCVKEVLELYREKKQKAEAGELLDLEKLERWERVKYNIYPILVSEKENESMKELYMYRKYLDLMILYVVRVSADGIGTVKITKAMTEQWGITEADLHARAMENLQEDGYTLRDLEQLLDELVLGTEDRAERGSQKDSESRMYVLTNSQKYFGAVGMMLSPQLVKKCIGRKNFYILPSSTHEVLILPDNKKFDAKELIDMVQTVNADCVVPEEKLADHVYYFDWEKRRMAILKKKNLC